MHTAESCIFHKMSTKCLDVVDVPLLPNSTLRGRMKKTIATLSPHELNEHCREEVIINTVFNRKVKTGLKHRCGTFIYAANVAIWGKDISLLQKCHEAKLSKFTSGTVCRVKLPVPEANAIKWYEAASDDCLSHFFEPGCLPVMTYESKTETPFEVMLLSVVWLPS